LREAVDVLAAKAGILLYLRQEGRSVGLYDKLDAPLLQGGGLDTFEANRELDFVNDLRDDRVAAPMLKGLGADSIRLLTNNSEKARQLADTGITIAGVAGSGGFFHETNAHYLRARIRHAGHLIALLEAAKA
jgi:GTP cyclohydrolase II